MTAVALRFECTALGLKALHRPCDAQVERNVTYCVNCDRTPLRSLDGEVSVPVDLEISLRGADPCACGGALKLSINRFKRSASVECQACGRVGRPGKTKDEAIAHWNDRPKHGGEKMGTALERLFSKGGSGDGHVKTVMVKIDAATHERFKALCVDRGVSMNDVVAALIVDFNASMAKPKG
jgi:hypothetical protein